MTDVPVVHEIVQTAKRVEEKRRRDIARMVLLVIALQLLQFALILALGFGAFAELRHQNHDLEQLVQENRAVAAEEAAQQDRILLAIGDRLVPKSEVRRLDKETRKLRHETKQLRQTVERLNRLLRQQGVAAGGG